MVIHHAKNILLSVLAFLVMGGAAAQENHEAMNHGGMVMSGGKGSENVRDPNAYADGYVRGSGLYTSSKTHLMMSDEHLFSSLLVDRLEYAHTNDGNAVNYEAQAWIGNTYDKFLIKAEGSVEKSRIADTRTELLWSHAVSPYWDVQSGLRNDAGHKLPGRNWLALGVQGTAPYWLETEATVYAGSGGRTALRLTVAYDQLLTQHLILQPRVEANVYGKDDPVWQSGRGLSDATLGLRLRYEFSRQFAPYIGIERSQNFGKTASMVRAAGGSQGETRYIVGVRFWF
ncbi:copper resistance protein B [Bordetella sp. FB-8]|uniref:copper resistance protein B n=1 Tax=Bordetella sp. FB-8 TaxID=1159870 RepID=UPI00035F0AC3|nr:copper resistance protein B [Bordetella sp. FB-8]